MKKPYIKPSNRVTELHPEACILLASGPESLRQHEEEGVRGDGALSSEKIWGHGLWDDEE